MEIIGKKAVIVGGASGMAKATAEMLREKGADIAILDLPTSAGAEVAKKLDGTFHAVDILDDNQTESALGEAVGALGGLHIVVNTAGGELTKDAAFPKRMGRPEEYARLAVTIVETPMLKGSCIRLDPASASPRSRARPWSGLADRDLTRSPRRRHLAAAGQIKRPVGARRLPAGRFRPRSTRPCAIR